MSPKDEKEMQPELPQEEMEEQPVSAQEDQDAEEVLLTPEQELEIKLAESEDRYKRVLAEYQNFRARSQKEREGMYLDNVAQTVSAFLPVMDTLERAVGQETDEAFKKSLGLITKQFEASLERFNVKPFGERGEDFDPNLHNAVMQAEDEELEPGKIAEVLLKGYMLGDKVVRHAMVKVSG